MELQLGDYDEEEVACQANVAAVMKGTLDDVWPPTEASTCPPSTSHSMPVLLFPCQLFCHKCYLYVLFPCQLFCHKCYLYGFLFMSICARLVHELCACVRLVHE